MGIYKGGTFNILRMLIKNLYRDPVRVLLKSFLLRNDINRDITNSITGISIAIIDSIILNPI